MKCHGWELHADGARRAASTMRITASRGTLRSVLAINAIMFVVIVAAAQYGQSTALLSDSLDNFGDALTYGLSLYFVAGSQAAKARVALFKGALILLAACVVAGRRSSFSGSSSASVAPSCVVAATSRCCSWL